MDWVCLFVVDSIANVGMARLTRRILPLFAVQVGVLLMALVPAIVTTLPHLLGFQATFSLFLFGPFRK